MTTVPAKKLIITDETNNQMIDSLGASYGEGTSLKLKCIAYGGKLIELFFLTSPTIPDKVNLNHYDSNIISNYIFQR